MSPNPTVASTVAPQYHPTIYCSISDVMLRSFPSTHVISVPCNFYTLLKLVKTSESACKSKNILKNKLAIDKMIYASVEMEIIFSSFLLSSFKGLRTETVEILKITKSGTYSSKGVICSISAPTITKS